MSFTTSAMMLDFKIHAHQMQLFCHVSNILNIVEERELEHNS